MHHAVLSPAVITSKIHRLPLSFASDFLNAGARDIISYPDYCVESLDTHEDELNILTGNIKCTQNESLYLADTRKYF